MEISISIRQARDGRWHAIVAARDFAQRPSELVYERFPVTEDGMQRDIPELLDLVQGAVDRVLMNRLPASGDGLGGPV
uniref:Uncharacterized protein n=1 Tax=uncultured prokaryote TaxID=198431 RepID=A0A0H5QNR5_9ZZZZ|nr:hypothetical protein [uncultured prokaryote]